jgi:polar amino acid transport system substrate-binding protein
LDKRHVAVVKGSIQARKLRADARTFNIMPIFIEVDTMAAVFDQVEKGRVFAGIVNRLFGTQQKDNFGLRESGVVIYPSRLMFIAPKGQGNRLLPAIDKHLADLKADRNSTYYKALQQTFSPAERPVLSELFLTPEELTWLAAHPTIRIGINQNWPPMDYLDEHGEPRGIGVGFIEAINRRLDGVLQIVALPWTELLEQAKNREIDALMDITPRSDREDVFSFTKPYLSVPHVIFALKDGPYYKNLSELSGRIVGVEKSFFVVRVLKERYPDIIIQEYADTGDALDAVARGETDAYVGNRAAAMYTIQKELIANLKPHGKIEETASVNSIGVRKDWPILRNIFQKSLDDLSSHEVDAILSEWVAPDLQEQHTKITLTSEEQQWIKSHPIVRLGYDSSWPPVEYHDPQDGYVVMSADITALISKLTGLQIEPVINSDWSTTLKQVHSGKIDLLASVSRTPQRESFLFFTEPYLNFPTVIVTNQQAPYIGTMNELNGRTVAVRHGHAMEEIIKTNHPEINVLLVFDTLEGLRAVARNDAYAFLDSLATVSHVIGREGMSGLKVSGEAPYRYELSIGISVAQPILAGIVKKAVAAISEQEQNNIYKRWISVTFEREVDYELVWKTLLGALFVLGLILLWNRRLAREISLRQQAEREMALAKEAAEKANRVKSAFLASMSHELRTPLNSIIGFNGIILKEMAGPLNLEQKKQLQMIRGSARHLLDLINDVLDISKIEAGELQLTYSKFDMGELLEQVWQELRPLADKKGLSFIKEVSDGVGLIESDERRVKQVLINLAGNAIKFTESGTVSIHCRTNNDMIMTTISDTGIGIPADDLDLLFQPFKQVDTGTARKYEGTGLGLYICKQVIAKLDGTMSVESIPGTGSTFTFTIPREKA